MKNKHTFYNDYHYHHYHHINTKSRNIFKVNKFSKYLINILEQLKLQRRKNCISIYKISLKSFASYFCLHWFLAQQIYTFIIIFFVIILFDEFIIFLILTYSFTTYMHTCMYLLVLTVNIFQVDQIMLIQCTNDLLEGNFILNWSLKYVECVEYIESNFYKLKITFTFLVT